MAIRRESGKPYSKVVETTFNVDEFAQAFAELRPVKPFLERVDDAVASARAFLAEREIPGCAQLYQSRQTGEYQCAKLDARDSGGFCTLDGYVLKHLGLKRDSYEHLAARVIVAADAMQRRDGEHALEAAFELGTLEILSRVYAAQSRQGRNNSPKNKRRAWAEDLAERLAHDGARDKEEAYKMIGDGHRSLVVDEDHEFYISGKNIIYYDPVTEKEVDQMTWGNFEKRYLRPELHKRGHQRR